MLSKTFLTAEELRINPIMYDALVKVYWLLVDETIPEKLFDMGDIAGPKIDAKGKPCGTAGCLLGWAMAVDQRAEWYDPAPNVCPINSLFYPSPSIGAYGAERAHGAQALHNYLTTGKANWRGVMKKG
jgi:hypothetical protein